MKILILGAGAWGSTLAYVFSQDHKSVTIWSKSADKLAKIDINNFYLNTQKITYNNLVETNANLDLALKEANIIVFCCTSETLRKLAIQIHELMIKNDLNINDYYILSAVKGLELETFCTMSQILTEIFPKAKIGALSGPNLAHEILENLPCASVIASDNDATVQYLQHNLTSNNLRLYANDDIIGVELGGAYKNVIALASGICDGLKLGNNAKASLLTRGIKEMAKLAKSFGAKPQTVYGLSGLGDLVATAFASSSRNYSCGLYLAQNIDKETIAQKLNAQIEGIPTTYAIMAYSKQNNIDLPITTQVYNVLSKTQQPREAIKVLMSRPLSKE